MANMTRSNWNWNIGVMTRRRRRHPERGEDIVSRAVNKVRVISSTRSANDSSREEETQNAAFEELRREQQNFQRKINEQQMVIDMLKSHLRDSESAAASEAARNLIARRRSAEASKRAKDRFDIIREKYDKMRCDLDVSYNYCYHRG